MSNLLLMKEQKALASLKNRVLECQKCNISQTCQQKVFGEGPIGARILSVAEAPGADEDKSGRPLVGRAGKYWDVMLDAAGLCRGDLYICNAIKCRPINNNYKKDFSEVDNCNGFLMEQIGIIKPKIILAFGKVAGYALGKISKTGPLAPALGRHVYTYTAMDGSLCTCDLVITYHPSYLMRPGERQLLANARVHVQLVEVRRLFDEVVNGEDRQ
jgi:uracil-DNA glycosylase family 4